MMPAADEVHPTLDDAAASYEHLVRTTGSGDLRPGPARAWAPTATSPRCSPASRSCTWTTGSPYAVTDSPKPPPERISLTFPALNRTEEVWFLVSGEGKAEAVARALAADGSVEETPARGITVENTTWFLDAPAASRPVDPPSGDFCRRGSTLTGDFWSPLARPTGQLDHGDAAASRG